LLEWTQQGATQLGIEMNVTFINGMAELPSAFDAVSEKVDAVLIGSVGKFQQNAMRRMVMVCG